MTKTIRFVKTKGLISQNNVSEMLSTPKTHLLFVLNKKADGITPSASLQTLRFALRCRRKLHNIPAGTGASTCTS